MNILRKIMLMLLGTVLFLSLNFLPTISSAQSPDVSRLQSLIQADELYLTGNTAGAEKLYRQIKPPFPKEKQGTTITAKAITDPEQLSGAGRVYWRNATEGMQQGLKSKIFVALDLLLEKQPEFVPAYALYVEAIKKYDKKEKVIPILEKGVTTFPDSVELNKALIKALEEEDKLLEASITARQFAIVYPQHPEANELKKIADKNFAGFRSQLNQQIITQGILGGAISIFSGNGINQSVLLAPLMLQGESAMGAQFASAYKQQLSLVDDPKLLEYINRIGNDIANLMGRNDFKYEFYIVKDKSINAFALPGGKIFVHTGAILAANSEAEIAGLLGHEIAHAVLSHSFQSITNANLLANVGRAIPLGNVISTLATLGYGRQQEAQSDIIGTRVLSNAGYAADGLRNFFVTLKQQSRQSVPSYLSTHPAPDSRVRYLEELIQRNGYNRYAFEGVKPYMEIKQKLQQVLGS